VFIGRMTESFQPTTTTTTTTTTQRNIKIQKEEEEITIEQPQHIGDTKRKLHEAA
jgi:hypothetical protein